MGKRNSLMILGKDTRKGGSKSGVDEEVKPFNLLCQVHPETMFPISFVFSWFDPLLYCLK